jgi:xylulokinase
MATPVTLGIDLGTQQLKVIAIDIDHVRVIGSVQAPIENISPDPGTIEQNPLKWWPLLCNLIRRLIEETEIETSAICGVGLSGHMHSIVPLKEDGTPAFNCIVWADTRAMSQAQAVSALEGVVLWNPSIAAYSVPKILWLKQNYPDAYAGVRQIVFSKDFLRLKMTGSLVTDYSDASGSLAWDFGARTWDALLLSRCGISADIFPAPRESTEVGGVLSEAAASDTGLQAGIPVSVGAGDVASAVVGSGIEVPSTVLINAGTAAQVILINEKPAPYLPERGARYLFEVGIDGRVFVMGALPSAGLSLEWWRALLGEGLSYSQLDELAKSKLGSLEGPLFMPYLQGTGTPHLNDSPFGTFLFMSSSTDLGDLTCAVMEGVAFGIKHCAEALLAGSDLLSRPIVITGGVTKSKLMRQVFADVFGRTILFREHSDVSAVGAAAFGAVAAKRVGSVHEFLERFPRDTQENSPETESVERFFTKYERFKKWTRKIVEEN